MATVATDTVDTTGLMEATERGPQRLRQSPPLLLTLPLWLTPLLMLMPGTATMAMDTVATDTVDTDTVDTTALMATMAMERGPQRLSQSPLLLLTLLLMLMPGTAIMATATTATDTDTATTVHTDTATMATERGPQRLRQSPPLLPTLTLWLTPLLMLMPGTATTATDTVAMDTVDTTGLMATMAIMERGLLRQSQSPLLLPTLTLLLIPGMAMMPGMAIMATATTATDTDTATTV